MRCHFELEAFYRKEAWRSMEIGDTWFSGVFTHLPAALWHRGLMYDDTQWHQRSLHERHWCLTWISEINIGFLPTYVGSG